MTFINHHNIKAGASDVHRHYIGYESRDFLCGDDTLEVLMLHFILCDIVYICEYLCRISCNCF